MLNWLYLVLFSVDCTSEETAVVVQLETIEQLCELGITVICCGGGGIPISRTADGQIVGHEAVIDKDLVSMLLAVRLGAPRFVITTSVDHVYEDFYSDDPRPHPELTAEQVRQLKERLIRAALEESGGNQRIAAEKLGMHRQSLTRMVRDLGLQPKSS